MWKDGNSTEHDMLAEVILRQFEAKGDPLKLLKVCDRLLLAMIMPKSGLKTF